MRHFIAFWIGTNVVMALSTHIARLEFAL